VTTFLLGVLMGIIISIVVLAGTLFTIWKSVEQ